jgi:hypothetical protein
MRLFVDSGFQGFNVSFFLLFRTSQTPCPSDQGRTSSFKKGGINWGLIAKEVNAI